MPEPLGPTTALIPGPNSTSVRSANDLKPWTRRPRRRAGALTGLRRRLVSVGRALAPRPSDRARGASAERSTRLAPRPTSRRPGATGPRRCPSTRPSTSDLDPELLLVVRPDRLEQVVDGPLAGRPLGVLLEAALGALERRQREVGRDLRLGARVDPVPGGLPAEVEVDGADQRLERRGEQGRPDAAATLGLALAEQEELRRGRAASASRARPGVLTIAARRADRTPSSSVGMAPVERLGDGEVDHGVAEELQPLVVPPAASGCSCSQLLWTSACASRSRSRIGSPRRSVSASAGCCIASPVGGD